MKVKLVLLSIMILQSALAANLEFDIKDGKFSLDVQKGWAPHVDHLGLPFVLIGPKYSGHRPTIAVIPTTLKKKFDPAKMLFSMESYKKGRIEFVRSMNGSVEDFIPYTVFKLDTVSMAHHYGYRYTINTFRYEEHNFLLECKVGQLYNLKVLTKGSKRSESAKDSIKVLKSFKCLK